MKIKLILLLLFLVYRTVSAHTVIQRVSNDTVLIAPEINPMYKGGSLELQNYLIKELKWPSSDFGYSGTVYIGFIVEKDGHITNVEVVRGLCSFCDKEAIRVISRMTDWTPGIDKGKEVRAKVILPVRFNLVE